MSKFVFKYFLPVFLLGLLVSCNKETDSPVPASEWETFHYSATIFQGAKDLTRASVGEDLKYLFEQGDRVYVQDSQDKLHGFLHLSFSSGEGKNVALFEGDLQCAQGFTPTAQTQITLVLVGSEDKVHTITEGKVEEGVNYNHQWAGTLSDAVRFFSHFTGSGALGDTQFTLHQNTSFLVCALDFDAQTTQAGTSVTATIYNNTSSTPVELHSITAPTEDVDGDVELSWVIPFVSGTVLSSAKMTVSRSGSADLNLKMADQTLADNNFYTFQRSTYLQNYFTVEAMQADTQITMNYDGVQYSKDGFEWATCDGSLMLDNKGDILYFKAKRLSYQNTGTTPLMTSTKPCYVYGDIMFLMCDSRYKPKTSMADFAFQGAFKDCTWLRLKAEKLLKLSAKTLSRGCYAEMFWGCTGITSLEGLDLRKDTALKDRCFDSMFYNASNLQSIPTGFLPWTELAFACYRRMFEGCTSLATIPSGLLPSTTLAKACYLRMFFGCSTMTIAPDLPAVNPQPGCYFCMFRNCSKLTYVWCAMYLTEAQRTVDRPSSYSDNADPPIANIETWTVINLWSVFNKWFNGVPSSGNLYKNKDMVYVNGNQIGQVPSGWKRYNIQ